MKKSTLLTIVALVLALAMGVSGTMAYLQDQDADVNVMTLGNVDIEQIELERDAEGNLQNFTQNKDLYPAVGTPAWDPERVLWPDVSESASSPVFDDEKLANVVDKFVFVENTGKSDAYVRTIFAFEVGEYDYDTVFGNYLIHTNSNDKNKSETGKGHWDFTWFKTPVTIDGNKYVLAEALYLGANSTQGTPEEGILVPGATSYPSLLQLFLDPSATNEDMVKLDGNANGTYDVLVVSQAVQTAGFANAKTALEAAFGKISAENHPWQGKAPNNNAPTDYPFENWSDVADENWEADDAATEYVIETAEELAAFAAEVNAGKTFQGKTVKLNADIDLDNKLWTPIGTSSNTFQGTFDGQGHIISNLFVNGGSNSYQGLFGFTTKGEVKNLTVDNAVVSGDLGVGVVAGSPYTSKYTNIKVTGLVKVDGFAYVGGVLGRNAYANVTDVTVDVDEGSYVRADSREDDIAYRTYVGGVIGFMGEGGHTVKNVSSNIDVYGSTIDVGGITGIAHYDNNFINCVCTGDVEVFATEGADEAEETGGIAGVWNNTTGHKVVFDGCKFTGKLTSNYTKGVDLSNNTIVGTPYSDPTTNFGELFIDGELISLTTP